MRTFLPLIHSTLSDAVRLNEALVAKIKIC